MSDTGSPPHAHPFRMIDVVLELEHEVSTTIKALTSDEVVRDSPDASWGGYPFALLLEAMAQAAIPLAEGEEHAGESGGNTRPGGLLVAIDHARLLAPARPGDRLLITCSLVRRLGALIRVRSVAEVAGSAPGTAVVAEGEFTIALEKTG